MKMTIGRDDLAQAAGQAVPTLERVVVQPVHKASRGFVNAAEVDVCELAVVTLLQAVGYAKPVLLLPITTLVRHQHQTLVTRGDLTLADVEGCTVGVRSWSQTTGVWVRGFLSEQYGVDLRKADWTVYEGSHVDGYQDPEYVRRAPEGSRLPTDFLEGRIEFGIMGNELPDAPGIRTVIPDAAKVAEEWSRETGFTPVNHVLAMTEAAAREHSAEILAAYDAMSAADADFAGFESLRPAVSKAGQYALDQDVLPRAVSYDELVDRSCAALGVAPSRLGG